MVPAVGAMTRNRLASVSPDQLLDAVLLAPPQPHRNAMSTPRRETPTSNRVASNMIADEPFMSEVMGSPASIVHTRVSVQGVALPYLRKCRTRVQTEALEALLTLSEPFTIQGVADQLGWTYSEALNWTREFRARGYLVASREGHSWTEAARRVG